MTLRGPVALISELEAPLPPIVVDVSALAAGRHRVELQWTPPEGLDVLEIFPTQITVALTVIPAPEPVEDDEDE